MINSGIGNNFDVTLNSLNPNLPKLRSNTSPSSSFVSSRSSQTSHHTSRSSLSSGGSIRSFNEHSRPRTSYEDAAKSTARSTSVSKSRSPGEVGVTGRRGYRSRSSLESDSDSSSLHSWLDFKERKGPPPPLFLHRTNFDRKPIATPEIELIAPGPPRVESRLSSYTTDPESPQPLSPASPDFQQPSEEDMRRRRHQKVMRTLGEEVPAELVYRGTKIPNVTIFPEPPSPNDSVDLDGKSRKTLARRGSLTLSNLSATLLPSHARSKSKDLLNQSRTPVSSMSTPSPFSRTHGLPDIITPTQGTYRSKTHPRPERPATIYSPITFARPISQAFSVFDPEIEAGFTAPTLSDKEAERAAKLARRASLSTATFLPTSPLRDGFRDITPVSPRSPLRPTYESGVCESPKEITNSHSRHLDFSFTVIDTDEHAEDDEDDDITAGERTPPSRKIYAHSEHGLDFFSTEKRGHSHSRSNPHLPLFTRPDTPFQSGLPLEDAHRHLKPEWNGEELLHRKERRQGWSGEWNQGDMQDVIKKLRNLK
ncbi:hypothetical protein H0H93_001400 [Arthromyces matolae]|nr:hypothetical protein H0H93_001400 [Arthromyces matolae]